MLRLSDSDGRLFFASAEGIGRADLLLPPAATVERPSAPRSPWTIDQVTTPHNGAVLASHNAIFAQVLYDAATGIY